MSVLYDKGPVVIGGGAAGLAACLTLEEAGYSPLLIEASDRLGGRLRTERLPDGTPVDRGFQVLQSAYPELQRWVDFEALDCTAFVPGAQVYLRGKWRTLADPRRALDWLPATLLSGIGNWSDRIKVLRLVLALQRCPTEDIQNGHFGGKVRSQSTPQPGPWALKSTANFLKEWGFSREFVADFLRPFFSGIFLEGSLETPAAQFQYTFRMLADGHVVRPKGGMEALVAQLASKLTRTEVKLGCRVEELTARGLRVNGALKPLQQGAVVAAPGVHQDYPTGQWNACINAVLQTRARRFGKPVIGLISEARKVTNFHFMEDLEGPQGSGRVNVTALLQPEETAEEAMVHIRNELLCAGVECGEVEWSALVRQALPCGRPVGDEPGGLVLDEGVFGAGDALLAPSLDGAMRSGRRAALAVVDWLNRTKQPHS